MEKPIHQVLEELTLWLKFQKDSGVDLIHPEVAQSLERLDMAVKRRKNAGQRTVSADLSMANSLSSLQAIVEQCRACGLSATRNKVVFGEGNTNPVLMIIGEAPGREEDRTGRPFVGKSGELLTKMLRAINIDRQEVFITSVVKCRPPSNRTPHKDEIEACLPYLQRQISLLDPKLILCLGGVAGQAVLGVNSSLSDLRGKFHQLHERKVAVTYHPAYLLRFGGNKQQNLKRKAWHDLQMLQKEYDKSRQKRPG